MQRWMMTIVAWTLWGAGLRAEEQALAALRVAQGVAAGAQLVEMSGERADPRPQQWTIVFNDPVARGGVREVVVANGAVLSQRTPLGGYVGGAEVPVVLNRVKLDSDEAFAAANKLAVAQRVTFNWVDFTLRAHNVTGTPVWVVRYFDHMGAQVGTAQISAESGDTIMPMEIAAGRLDEERSPTERRIGGLIGTVGGILENTAKTVSNATLRAVGTVEETLTGERTIGPKDDDE